MKNESGQTEVIETTIEDITNREELLKLEGGKDWWIVPGGKLTTEDYIHGQKETPHYWYDVLEKALRREVKEEAGIEIENIRYVTSLADYEEDKDPSVVISCLVDHASGEVVIQKEEMQGFKWVRLQEAQSLDLIEGIYEELVMADRVLNGEKVGEWTQ